MTYIDKDGFDGRDMVIPGSGDAAASIVALAATAVAAAVPAPAVAIADGNADVPPGAAPAIDAAASARVIEEPVPEGWLPELWRNPFTRVLGAPSEWVDLHDALVVTPERSESERKLPHTLRRYCVLRVFDAVVPVEAQVDLSERIGMVIRQGYKARDPARGTHRPALLASAAAIQKLAGGADVASAKGQMPVLTHSHPVAFALIGDPGTGKTTITRRTLAGIQQVVEQSLPYAIIKQVVWLEVQCPSTGGRKQLCIAILAAFDRLLGTRYAERFGAEGKRVSGDQMMLFVQHLVTLHAVGLIVIDEIQHAKQSTEGVKPLMNFLVTLVNSLSVPVMLIGTNDARSIVEGEFREARRASGLGQPNWFRMSRGEEWDDWLKGLWVNQWTATPTELTPAISEAIYDESQGVIDLAVKLYVLGQFRAISRGEGYGEEEVLTPELFRAVARDEFALIAPMITAMRENRQDLLAQYADLEPLHQHIERLLCQETGKSMRDLRYLRDLKQRISNAEENARNAPWLKLKASLVQRGHASEVVERVVAEAEQRVGIDDLVAMVEAVNDLLAAEPAPRPDKVRKPANPKTELPADSLPVVGKSTGDPLEALRAAGIVATPDEIAGS